jgi:flavodoxin
MKSLVVFYSRTGNTKKIAEIIAESLNSDLDEIIDTKKRFGFFRFLKAGYEATMKKMTEIKGIEKDPSDYELVILGSPIWNKRMTPAIRTYITRYREEFNKIAIYCSAGGRGVDQMLESIAELCDRKPLAMKAFLDKDFEQNLVEKKVEQFINSIKSNS